VGTPELSMRIEHVALWTSDLERARGFYERYFGAHSGELYRSRTRHGFASYFLTFPNGGSRLELMTLPDLCAGTRLTTGWAHVAVTVGTRSAVDALTARMAADGVRIVSAPRETGDGYYESVVEDPDGNQIEITGDG
jgi:lactoylglutathione lyase